MDIRKLKVFISYSHKDERLKRLLEKHLSVLQKNISIEYWSDKNILPGENWENMISEKLEAADIILLLVSANFLSSDYCYNVELQRAIDRHQAGKVTMIPIILEPVYWNELDISKLQALPTGAIPISKWNNKHEACANVTKGIRDAVITSADVLARNNIEDESRRALWRVKRITSSRLKLKRNIDPRLNSNIKKGSATTSQNENKHTKIQLEVAGLTTHSPHLSLSSIMPALSSQVYLLTFKEINGTRTLNIPIGYVEAQAIALHLEGIKPPRPLTHDLIKSFISEFQATITEIVISKFENAVFCSTIFCTLNRKKLKIDSRTSDAVAIAIRLNVPIFVHADILQEMNSTIAFPLVPTEEVVIHK
jgi:bifunctional DNase/RNase